MGNVNSAAEFTEQALQRTPFSDAEALQYTEEDLLDEKWCTRCP